MTNRIVSGETVIQNLAKMQISVKKKDIKGLSVTIRLEKWAVYSRENSVLTNGRKGGIDDCQKSGK